MSKRIVLVDPVGNELFSGMSLASDAPTTAAEVIVDHEDDDIEACPDTLRSPVSDSGIFPSVRRPRVDLDAVDVHAVTLDDEGWDDAHEVVMEGDDRAA